MHARKERDTLRLVACGAAAGHHQKVAIARPAERMAEVTQARLALLRHIQVAGLDVILAKPALLQAVADLRNIHAATCNALHMGPPL